MSQRAIRTNPELRKAQILEAAITLSKHKGYRGITRDAVADCVGVTSSLIAAYYPRMAQLREAVLQEAIEKGIVEIVAQGLSVNDPRVDYIPAKLKKKVVKYLSEK